MFVVTVTVAVAVTVIVTVVVAFTSSRSRSGRKNRIGCNFKLIPVHKVLISKPVVTAVRSQTVYTFKGSFLKDPSPVPFPLSRMSDVGSVFDKTYLPPVTLTPYGTTGYYQIVDGRHRFALSLVNGMTHVPATFH